MFAVLRNSARVHRLDFNCCYLIFSERPCILSPIYADFLTQQKITFQPELDTQAFWEDYIAQEEIGTVAAFS